MTSEPTSTVRFGRLERRGVMLGLSGGQLACVGAVLAIAVIAEYTAGGIGVLTTAPVWLTLAIVGLVVKGGRPLLAWLPVAGQWWARCACRRTTQLTSPLETRQPDTLTLPGLRARLTISSSPSTGAACLLDPRAATVTAIVEVSGRGFALDDAGTQDRRVTGWGRVLAAMCQQPDVARVQVLHRSLPGGATAVRRWWTTHALTDSPWAARLVAEVLDGADAESDRIECLVAIALQAPRGSRRRLSEAGQATVDQHLAAFYTALLAADLDVHGWVTPGRLRRVLRSAYDPLGGSPVDGQAIDECPAARCAPVGPMGVTESWDSVRTDSGFHTVYWVAEWPRSDVHTGFLQPLVLAPGARRAFSLIAEPLSPTRALREIRRAKVEHTADATQRARIGRLEDESTRAEAADLIRREHDLVAGHGDLRFAGFVTVTAADQRSLAAACAATEAAAAQAMCELRRLVGQQLQAHVAASLPLGRGLL
jgi:hypothetical protein